MPVGRIISRRLYLSISGLKSPFAHIRLSKSSKEDLAVWTRFLDSFNGHSFFQLDLIVAPDFRLFTDATGSKGFAAIWRMYWCCAAWPESWHSKQATKNVVLLESFPVLVALELWGRQFENRRILVETDNTGVLLPINCLSSSSLFRVAVLRQVFFLCLEFNIWLEAKYSI